MLRHPRVWAVLTCAVTACSNHPSKLDPTVQGIEMKRGGDGNSTADPWAASSAAATPTKSDGGGGMGELDLKEMLKKVSESISKPGPYEAPEQSKDFDETKPHWGVLELGGDVVERQAYSWRGGNGTELRTLIERLRAFARQDKLAGIVLRVSGLDISLPDVLELRAAMHALRQAGKQLACHTEDATNATYLVLAACDRIGIAPLGQIAITGPAAMPIHVKPLLDKLGVQADFLHVGAYKGAAEPLTREAPSKEMQETIGAILDRHYQTMVDVIVADRKIDQATAKGLIDTAMFSSDEAATAKLVDEVDSFEGFRQHIAKAPWTEVKLEDSVGATGEQLRTMLKLARFVGAMPPERPTGDHVALVYAIGNIVDGDDGGVLGARQQIASHTLVPALRAIGDDASVKAVVLRIDSGGGSAQASELIWRAVAEVKQKKPVIVSMSDVAASGGYYIATGATKIYAMNDTLTGSIGVVGGKLAPGGALSKAGINAFPMGRGKHATIMASLSPWSADERAIIQRSMEDVYKTFVGRVADGRKKPVNKISVIAQGRVWTGASALELGLVDEIGGLDAALAEAHELAHLEPSTDVEVYPPAPTLRDFIHGFSGVQAPLGASAALEVAGAVSPRLRAAAEDLLALVMSFQATRVQTVAVLPTIR